MGVSDEFPDNLQSLIDHIGFHQPDEEILEQTGMKETWDHMVEGHCCLCKAPAGRDAQLIINSQGVLMIYCGGACLSDQFAMSWLEEQYKDLQQHAAFRAGSGDEPEEP